jgi:hypothetical protein
LLLAAALVLGAAEFSLSPDVRAALELISAGSLRGDVSFLASDVLEGRDTPSRGLDVAAEYIAAQFRRAGLEPAGDDGYFQTASIVLPSRNRDQPLPLREPVKLHNVAGVLRGSDPVLKDSCVLVSAHYDHLGVRPAGDSNSRLLAQAGIPAHTVSVGFIFPDYHRPGDHWDKLDYPNMEKIVRAVAAGVLMIAASDEAPRWNAGKPQADRCRKVREPQRANP